MSKISRPFLLVFAAAMLILQLFNNSNGQDIEATVTLDSSSPNIAHIQGHFLWGRATPRGRNLSYLRHYAGVNNLAERISAVSLRAADGSSVAFKRLMAGEYLADGDFSEWSYTIDLTPLKDATAAAHTSWVTSARGILFMDDILPQTRGGSAATIVLRLPGNGMAADPRTDDDNTFVFVDKERAVLYLGPTNSRLKSVRSGKTDVVLSIAGDWHFTDEAASMITSEVFREYERIFGSSPTDRFNINIQRFPVPVAIGTYEADTRGRKITILSSDMPLNTQSLQRLHEQLRHEMFHLWIPEGVNLTGNYDWFYEGFALYQSLKLGVSVNRIRFDDYLDTLSRAYETDKRLRRQGSLIDASKERWTNDNNTVVYARGMLVAFLCDLALLDATKGKVSTDDIVRDVYTKHSGSAAPQDGNAAVIGILKSHKELVPIVENYVSGANTLDWAGLLRSAGLQAETSSGVTTLAVIPKPNGSQKRLLDKLGYNNWRKLSSK